MARIYPLFSSSKGNAVFVGSPASGILIDAGVSAKRLKAGMERCGLSAEAVRGIFITHSHSDHVTGLRVFCRQCRAPVYVQPRTLSELKRGGQITEETQTVQIGDNPVCIADMQVIPFETMHDTAQSCGYRVNLADGRSCAVCTDLGIVTKTVERALTGCDLVLLEANYDETMLRNGSYPPTVKARIASDYGHLSNTASGSLAAKLVASGTVRLILGHLSEANNTPELAETAVTQALSGAVRGKDYLLETARPETDGRMIAF